MGLLTDYITDRHNNQLNQQKTVLDFYSNAMGGDHPDSEVNHIGQERYMKYSGYAPKKFNDPKIAQQMMDDSKLFEEMNAKARGRQQSSPPTQSLASQGPPSAQAPQVPPPPNGGGNNYGQFAGQPSAIMGQMVAPQQPASDAMGAISPPPQPMSVPPPPPQGVDTSAVPSFRDISATRGLDRKGFTDAALKFGAQYGAEYAAKSKADIETDLSKAVNERTLREQDLKKVQPLIDALPDHPTMRDYAKLEVGASTILGRPFTIPGMGLMGRPQNIPGQPISNKALLEQDPDAAYNVNGKAVPLDPNGFSKLQIGPEGRIYQPAEIRNLEKVITTPDGKSYMTSINPITNEVTLGKEVLNPAMVGTEYSGMEPKIQQNADGSTSLVWVPIQRSSKKVIPGVTPPPPSSGGGSSPPAGMQPSRGSVTPSAAGSSSSPYRTIPFGGKPMAPEQKVKNEQQAELYNTSIGNIASLKRDLPILADMVSAGKIAIQASPNDGFLHGIIARKMPLSDREAAAAAHWQQLNDEIFELRIPLGAAAGRNAAMMATIQANRGTLGQNTKVLAKMLENAQAEFRNLRKPLAEAGQKYGYTVEPELSKARDEMSSADQLPLVKTKPEFDALPKGARYTEEDGKVYVKP